MVLPGKKTAYLKNDTIFNSNIITAVPQGAARKICPAI
jgi:hypothetical protein